MNFRWVLVTTALIAIPEIVYSADDEAKYQIWSFLPTWITVAGIPALSVMGFFWKGDEALSEDFKKWLSQKILGAKLTVPDISSLAPLGRVFDFIFGRRYFALTTFLRVAAISVVALIVVILAIVSVDKAELREIETGYESLFLIKLQFALLISNILCDYLSITKARLLINRITRLKTRFHVILFVVSDLIATCCIVFLNIFLNAGLYVVMIKQTTMDAKPLFWLLGLYGFAFGLTTFLTLLLTILYSLALLCLRALGVIKKAMGLIQWMLPVQTLPVRSIGLIAGGLLFCFLEISHALVR